jgi:surface antigen
MLKKLLIIVTALSLAACTTNSGPKEQGGAVMGAVTGALLGAALSDGGRRHGWRGRHHRGGPDAAAVVFGAIAGGLIGSGIGRKLDEADRQKMQYAQYEAFEYNRSGESSHWHNPDSGHYGAVTPEPAYERGPGEYCREYQQTVVIGGQEQDAYGTACRRPDGSWEIMNDG